MNIIKITFLFLFTNLCFGQDYLLHNEELIYSFKVKNGKMMFLVKDKENKYIVYRFGSSNKIELEYPQKNKQSWNKFTYSYYSRGGGKANDAMELYSIYFKVNNFEYTIYKDYYSENESFKTGILIINNLNKRVLDIKGKYNSIKGNPNLLKSENLINEEQERIR